jgi:ABC-type branched-subunit amino acid transport system substrate-binding protein
MMPNFMAALAYDSMNLIKETLITLNKTVCYGNVASDRADFSDALKKRTGFIGATGKITFGVDNNPVNRCVVLDIISNSIPMFYHGVC